MSFLKRLVNNLNIPLIHFYIHETIIFPPILNTYISVLALTLQILLILQNFLLISYP